jgi:AhpD family alkylhydroperoxidase
MTRVTKLSVEELPSEFRVSVRADDKTPLELGLSRFFGHQPEMAAGLHKFAGSLKVNRSLPPRLIELVRLRVAFFNQCRSCMAIRYPDALNDGLNEGLVCSLEKPAEATDLSDAEKAAIRFGELFATDHLAIDDAVYAELRKHFTDAQVVELGLNVALFVGVGRFAATLHMVEELPDVFQDTEVGHGAVAPWGNDHVVMS